MAQSASKGNEKIKKPAQNSEPQEPQTQSASKGNETSLQVGTAVSRVISSSATEPVEDTSLVAVKITYPKDYKGKMFFKNGEVKKMSNEVAKQLVRLGIAEKI